ncbi:hypothetical protein R1sor_014910 [Riccia sorocarpa]|uniref:SAP domain-containing protein n=1 Tax=Riccia sorocarpa TaxID=122646 RepID=A0ABD3HEZ4_9MARC
MTRPPRPKYPSDARNYHEVRKPGFAHTVRLPEDLLDKYAELKTALGPRKSHTDVIRFLFEAAEPAITSMLTNRANRVVLDWTGEGDVDVVMQADPDVAVAEDLPAEDDQSEESDGEIARELGQVAADSDDDPEISCCVDSQIQREVESTLSPYPDATYAFWAKSSVDGATTIAQVAVFSVQQLRDFCRANNLQSTGSKLGLVQRVSIFLNLPEAGGTQELQRQRPLKYPELAQHDLAYKLKPWIYTCAKNAATRGDTTPENWEPGRETKYAEGGETHKAVKEWLKKVFN